MSFVYNKNVFLTNVYILAKQKGIKINELEADAGVSTGYLSRMKKESYNAIPGIDFVLSIANKLQVSVDTLLKRPLDAKTDTEIMILKFMDVLIRETRDESRIWDAESVKEFLKIEYDDYGNPHFHSLSKEIPLNDNSGRSDVRYYSPSYPDAIVEPQDNYYVTALNADSSIFLVKYAPVQLVDGIPTETGEKEMDLLIYNFGKVSLLAHFDSENKSSVFNEKLSELLNTILEANSHTHLSPEVKFAIQEYLKIDEDDLPF